MLFVYNLQESTTRSVRTFVSSAERNLFSHIARYKFRVPDHPHQGGVPFVDPLRKHPINTKTGERGALSSKTIAISWWSCDLSYEYFLITPLKHNKMSSHTFSSTHACFAISQLVAAIRHQPPLMESVYIFFGWFLGGISKLQLIVQYGHTGLQSQMRSAA